MKPKNFWLILTIAVIVLGWLVATSGSFEKCIHERKDAKPYQALHEERSLFVKAVARLNLHATCARVTASENDAAITALATILIAAFTLALWRSTDKLWKAADLQRADALRSIVATEKAAEAAMRSANVAESALTMVERPILIPTLTPLPVGYKSSDWLASDFPAIFISFTNHGKTPAIADYLVADLIGGKICPRNPFSYSRRRIIFHDPVAPPNGGRIGIRAHNPDGRIRASKPFSQAEKNDILARRTSAWLAGYVRYSDVFENFHTLYFVFQYEPDLDAFVRHGEGTENHTEHTGRIKNPLE